MEDNKVSHMDDNVNPMIAEKIEESFGKLSCITGKKQIFFCMDIKFIGGKKVTVYIPHHIDEALEDFDETLKGKVVNPVTSQLFTITSEAKELDDKKGALALYNFQKLVNREAFTDRLGKGCVFSMH